MRKFRGGIVKVMMAWTMIAVLGLPAGIAAATSARPSDALSPSIHVSPPKGSSGSLVTVMGSGFRCATVVDVLWQYTKGDPIVTQYMGSSSVTRRGEFSMAVRVPIALPGPSTVIATVPGSRSCRASILFRICSCDAAGYRPESR